MQPQVGFGVRVVARDSFTLDALAELHAPAPVEPGDLLADDVALYRVESVLAASPGAPVVRVLARRLDESA